MPRKNHKNSFDKVRGITGMAMGIVYIMAAFMVVFAEKHRMIDIGITTAFIIGILAFLYGIFRIYRGWKINRNAA